jgi:hypothetical protein
VLAAQEELQIAGHVSEHEQQQDDAGHRHHDFLADQRVRERRHAGHRGLRVGWDVPG